jgi:uncharacterized iron-regulated membrane protein
LWAVVTALLPAVATWLPVLGELVPAALAATAEPTPGAGNGDPRSNGQGPGLVGTPGLAILGVLAIAIAAIVATTIWVRWTAPRDRPPTPRPNPAARRRNRR